METQLLIASITIFMIPYKAEFSGNCQRQKIFIFVCEALRLSVLSRTAAVMFEYEKGTTRGNEK